MNLMRRCALLARLHGSAYMVITFFVLLVSKKIKFMVRNAHEVTHNPRRYVLLYDVISMYIVLIKSYLSNRKINFDVDKKDKKSLDNTDFLKKYIYTICF